MPATTQRYRILLRGERTTEPQLVQAKLELEVEAETFELAEVIVKGSLPGFDWKWQSGWGLAEIERDPA